MEGTRHLQGTESLAVGRGCSTSNAEQSQREGGEEEGSSCQVQTSQN